MSVVVCRYSYEEAAFTGVLEIMLCLWRYGSHLAMNPGGWVGELKPRARAVTTRLRR
jgi:hypothetical protein